MVFNGIGFLEVIFFVLVTWMAGLTYFVLRMVRHYNKLTGGADKIGLKEVLEQMLVAQKGLQGETKDLYKVLDEVKREGRFHVQRIGLVRFNPFSDTGGSQSFTFTMLDGHNNGLVMTSLYARSGHRWYIKEVEGGKGKELALSKEEQAAIKQAYE